MLAYHNNPAIKEKYLNRVKAHQAADEIIHGVYWDRDKGCAVGCTVHSDSHAAYETELGIPRVLARIEDGIFEGLGNGSASLWPVNFLDAINVGSDLSGVADKFLHWLLIDPVDGIINLAKTEKSKTAIRNVGDLYERKIKGETITDEEWRKARSAAAAAYDAYSAAAAAADAAYAAAYAAYAADAAAAYAADAAAAYAAYAAYAADAAYAGKLAKQKARQRQAEKLLELLKAA